MSNQQIRGGRGADRPSDRITKADKKEQARLEREEIQRQMDRRRRTRAIGLLAGLGGLAIVIVLMVALGGGEDPPAAGETNSAAGLPGLMTDPGPWPENNDQLGDRLSVLDLPPFLDQEGVGQHRHVRIWLFVGGEEVEVPANIGYDETRGVASPLHTHDVTGTLHVESADAEWEPTLGEFFDGWGLRLSSTCLGGNCAADELALRVFVDGEEVEGNPRDIPLADQSAIVVTFGTEEQLPDPMPNSFSFSDG
ncbi:MAG TPA: hypothetical protein VF235_07550 [Actinomycetota bacterium]